MIYMFAYFNFFSISRIYSSLSAPFSIIGSSFLPVWFGWFQCLGDISFKSSYSKGKTVWTPTSTYIFSLFIFSKLILELICWLSNCCTSLIFDLISLICFISISFSSFDFLFCFCPLSIFIFICCSELLYFSCMLFLAVFSFVSCSHSYTFSSVNWSIYTWSFSFWLSLFSSFRVRSCTCWSNSSLIYSNSCSFLLCSVSCLCWMSMFWTLESSLAWFLDSSMLLMDCLRLSICSRSLLFKVVPSCMLSLLLAIFYVSVLTILDRIAFFSWNSWILFSRIDSYSELWVSIDEILSKFKFKGNKNVKFKKYW